MAILKDAKTIVIKIGSVLIREAETNKVRTDWFAALAEDIEYLRMQGKRIIIVSSGGIALGREALGIPLDLAPSKIPLAQKQAASAVGQFHMYAAYHEALKVRGLVTAQVLLTMAETENRRMHLNARETLFTLMDKGIVPVINENDTVSTGEIRFGDNDRLAARVAQMVDADLVVLLSTIDGLYTDNPQKNTEAAHIPLVEKIGETHVQMAGEAVPGLSTGGMKSKIEAALAATQAGIPLIIANGMKNHALKSVFDDKNARFTLFMAQESKNNARKRWIGAHLSPKGRIFVDKGAENALKTGKSLLPVGVKRIEGTFKRGDIVTIHNEDGTPLGSGISGYNAEEAVKITGKSSQDIAAILGYAGREEIIHRNDMVLKG